jgi:AcrR family transcriptional regulator
VPRLIVPEGRTNTVVDAMNFVLSRDGAAGLTLRTIARESRVSTSSLLHHYGSREHLIRVAAGTTGRARLREIERRAVKEGVGAFLPGEGDAEDLITARAWLGWCALWRCTDSLAGTISDIRDRELVLLAETLGVHPFRDDLTAVVALIDGLTAAVCAPVHPLSPARGREILAAQAARHPSQGTS